MQFKEEIAIHLDNKNNDECPFCPGKKEAKWISFIGEDNNSTMLKSCMLKPERNKYSQQKEARPKDGKDGRQNKDVEVDEPNPYWNSPIYGEYSYQAHHSISGNEIMKGHPVEQFIKKSCEIKEDTGYTINNCANGVFLPAYPKAYKGIWGAESYPKSYPINGGTKKYTVENSTEDQVFKLKCMEPAMERRGQAHIGGHEGFYIEDLVEYKDSYPTVIKDKLDEIVRRIIKKSGECPFCFEGDEPKKPFIPPYKVNQWLDNLSRSIEKRLTAAPEKWPYFISQISMDYFKKVTAGRPSAKHKLQ